MITAVLEIAFEREQSHFFSQDDVLTAAGMKRRRSREENVSFGIYKYLSYEFVLCRRVYSTSFLACGSIH